ncbi:hypothetical protein FPC840_20018 [Flavobacterium psychrophilum]|nr:hypothetical protein FPC840_20018 [Flavobacterium psychrophilum]
MNIFEKKGEIKISPFFITANKNNLSFSIRQITNRIFVFLKIVSLVTKTHKPAYFTILLF